MCNGVAPSSSMLRRITVEESPDPDLKDMNLFARAAPDSDIDSEEDPAFGKVRDTVEVEDALSDTTVSPFARVVTDADPAEAASGEVAGILFQINHGTKKELASLW